MTAKIIKLEVEDADTVAVWVEVQDGERAADFRFVVPLAEAQRYRLGQRRVLRLGVVVRQ